MTDEVNQDGQAKLARELQAIREQMGRLELRVESLTGKEKPSPQDRIKTFVNGLDEALDGGVPQGHVVLLAGPSGTMKTSLALYIMERNRAQGLKGVYITLEESRQSLLKTMVRLGLESDEDFIVDIGKLRTEHEAAEETRDWLQILKDYLSRRLDKGKLDLVVVDPLNSLYALASIKSPRKDLFHFFTFLRSMGVTSLLVYEAETKDSFFPNHEDFLADGVLLMDFSENASGDFGLQVRCQKMRHANHSRANFSLGFCDKEFSVKPAAHSKGNEHPGKQP